MADTSITETRLHQPILLLEMNPLRRLVALIGSYVQLTKPTIMLLVLITGATALVLEGSFLMRPLKFLLVMLGLYLTGGCANALNQYFEREVDARMKRTAKRRPLPQGLISPRSALIFSIGIGVVGVSIFWYFFNPLTALLSLGTILFYSLFYTLYLKPNTYQNIVIGGAAGAMAPVGAWTAATGSMALMPWSIFLIVFLWTPPHFWALALLCKEDYREVGYPMLPVLKGDSATHNQILIYSWILIAASMLPLADGASWFYSVSAVGLGSLFIVRALQARKSRASADVKRLFGYSIIYLFAICAALMIDKFVA
ncbi:MAG: heme o synthase [Candidatus Zixiibacteriota bacterium]